MLNITQVIMFSKHSGNFKAPIFSVHETIRHGRHSQRRAHYVNLASPKKWLGLHDVIQYTHAQSAKKMNGEERECDEESGNALEHELDRE